MKESTAFINELTLESVARRRESNNLNAVLAIAELDPHALGDLADSIAALHEAQAEKDHAAVRIALQAMREVFKEHEPQDQVTMSQWSDSLSSRSPVHAEAKTRRSALNNVFYAKYEQAKHNKGFNTQRQVADACGLSINTVASVECNKVKPQSGTLQKLAEGLGVEISHLLGTDMGEPHH